MREILERDNKEISQTIYNQLGGTSKLKAMIGAKDFTYDKDGNVGFKFPTSKNINYIKIRLNSKDLYDIEFGKIVKFDYKIIKVEKDVYNDQLKKVIESNIGKYLSL